MKKHVFNKSLMAVSLLLMTASASAQSASSGYFVEGFSQRYQLNPAFSPDRPLFLAIPGVSNIQMEATSTVGLSNFLFESTSKPGMLTTFMSPDVDTRQFLDKLPDVTQFNVGLNMDILSLGIGGENGFTSFNIKLKNREQISMPKELFSFMKASFANGNYLIEDININTTSYLETSLTHAHRINDNLNIGVGLKFLVGVAYADINIDEIDARLGDEEWLVRTNATIKAAVPGVEYTLTEDDGTLDGAEYSFKSPLGSYGFAVDLGAEYDFKDLVKGLKVSASITDLGFINWDNMNTFATDNDEYVRFHGFDNYDTSGDDDKTMDNLGDDFKEMTKVYPSGTAGKENVALNATFRLGAEYVIPYVEWISVGELFTYRGGLISYKESRTSLTLSPCRWFDLSGNVGFTSVGTSMGMLLNVHPRGINFFFAVDHLKADFNPQYVPLRDFGLNFSLGLNLAFGQKRY